MDGNSILNYQNPQSTDRDINLTQLGNFIDRLSTDDRQMFIREIGEAQREVIFKRALPFTVFGVGSIYYARTKLKIPSLLKPNPISLYFSVGSILFLSSQYFSRSIVHKRIQSLHRTLSEKYQTIEQNEQNVSKHGTYEELRRINRHGNSNFNEPPPLDSDNYNEMGNVKPNAFDNKFNLGLIKDDNPNEAPRMNTDPNRQKNPYAGYDFDSYGYMPGTPVSKISNENFRNNDRSEKPSYDSSTKNKYGDTNFS